MFGISYIFIRLKSYVTRGVNAACKKNIYSKIADVPPTLLSDYSTGNLINVTLDDSAHIVDYCYTLCSYLLDVISVIIIGGILLFTDKAVFLDRDGTINVDRGYISSPKDFVLLPKVIDGLKLLQQKGYLIIVITNQSGIARGYFTKEAYYNLTNYMLNLFKENDIYLTAVLHCPHGDGQCNCRKPRPGLFYYAAAQFNIDFRKSFAVGNELRDLCICSYEPVTGILLSEGNEPVGESGDSIICLNDLYSACRFISEHG